MPDSPTNRVEPRTESFYVRSYDIAPTGRASVPALCNYLQEAAGNHARALGFSMESLLDQGQAWVLSHLHLRVHQYPRWQSTVTVETWPSGVEKVYATREFVLRDEDDTVLAEATSAWLVIDTERRRPLRPPDALRTLTPPDRPAPLPHNFNRLSPIEVSEHERRFRVRYNDLDINEHVNNVHFAAWAIETLPEDVLTTQQIKEVRVQYRAEATLGTTVLAHATRTRDGYRHHLVDADDQRTLALATTTWTDGV